MSKLILWPIDRPPTDLNQLRGWLVANFGNVTSPAPPTKPAPAATTTPPAWAVKLQQRLAVQQQRIEALVGEATALKAGQQQPLIEFILANSEVYVAEELGKLSQADLERIARLVDQAVGPKGRLNALTAQGLLAKPLSLIETIRRERV